MAKQLFLQKIVYFLKIDFYQHLLALMAQIRKPKWIFVYLAVNSYKRLGFCSNYHRLLSVLGSTILSYFLVLFLTGFKIFYSNKQHEVFYILIQVAMATGQVLFHRFYHSKSFVRQPMEITAMGCLCCASKVEEAPRRIRDIISVFEHIKQVRGGK